MESNDEQKPSAKWSEAECGSVSKREGGLKVGLARKLMPVTGQGGGTAHRRHMRAAAGRPLIKIKVQASRDPS